MFSIGTDPSRLRENWLERFRVVHKAVLIEDSGMVVEVLTGWDNNWLKCWQHILSSRSGSLKRASWSGLDL